MSSNRKGYIVLLVFVLILVVAGVSVRAVNPEPFCSIDNSTGCSVQEGKLTLDPIEADAFLSKARDEVCVVYFFSTTCPHCQNIKPFIDSLEQKYAGEMHFSRYDVSNPENIQLYNKLCALRSYSGKGIPLVGVNDQILVGEVQIRERLEQEIIRGMAMPEKICPLGERSATWSTSAGAIAQIHSLPNAKDLTWGSVVPIVIIAGLGDGINPCAFIILIFVMVFLQQISGSKIRLLKVTLTYIIALFVTNTLLGIGYYALSVNVGYPQVIRTIIVVVAVCAGIINIKDFFFYGKGISLGIPAKSKKYLTELINKASVSASFVLGVSVAALEAPCSVPIYLAVIEVLKAEGSTLAGVFPYILLYNVMFTLPLIVLAVLTYFGFKADTFERASLPAKRYMKLIIGLLLLVLALALFKGWL